MKYREFSATIVSVAVATILLVGTFFWVLRSEPGAFSGSGKPKVVTTFLPIYVFTVNVAGDMAEVENLLPPGVGPHEYSFTPAEMKRVVSADLIVANGLGLEEWMTDLVKKSGTGAKVLEAGVGLGTRPPSEEVALDAGGAGEEHAIDPHVWLDPLLAREMVGAIAEGLVSVDPEHAADYRRNAAEYSKRLKVLDSEFREALSPIADKDFVAFHSAFGYLADRYGMNQVAVIEEFPGKEPSAKYLAGLVDLIRSRGIRTLFSEPQFSPKVAETVAGESGARVYELDTVEVGDLDPDTYVEAMRANLKTLSRAFSS